MLHPRIILNADEIKDAIEGEVDIVGALDGGMASGKPSVVIVVLLPDVRVLKEWSTQVVCTGNGNGGGGCGAKLLVDSGRPL